jgi:hypothetical protein
MISPVKGKTTGGNASQVISVVVSIQMISPVKGKKAKKIYPQGWSTAAVSIQMISPVKGKFRTNQKLKLRTNYSFHSNDFPC